MHKALLPCAASESVCALPGWVRDGSVAVWWRGVSVKVVGGTVRRGAAAVVAGGRWGGGSSVVMWPSCDECGEHESDAHLSRRWCRFGRWGGGGSSPGAAAASGIVGSVVLFFGPVDAGLKKLPTPG